MKAFFAFLQFPTFDSVGRSDGTSFPRKLSQGVGVLQASKELASSLEEFILRVILSIFVSENRNELDRIHE